MTGRKDENAPGDENKQGEPTQRGREKHPRKTPPAGPHADPSLTNEDATPGAGTLPPPDGEPNGGGSVSS